jgi:membrane-bound lytic murein transglycosylase B
MVTMHHFDRQKLTDLFKEVTPQKSSLAVYHPKPKHKPHSTSAKPKPKPKQYGSWDRYKKRFLYPAIIQRGVSFMHAHRKTLLRAYQTYGVAPEYITAIIGVESHYGRNRGSYPVFDTLTTLAFEKNRRQKFYRSELEAFLLMTRREKVNPKRVKGSWAGAIGLGQFMPSNYQAYMVDFNHDGFHQMNNPDDAIGSIAHYFKRHGWQKEIPVATRVSYEGMRYSAQKTGYRYRYDRSTLKGIHPREPFDYHKKVHLIKLERKKYDELWYATENFYAITRYNHSSYYAMAIHQLAQRIKQKYQETYGEILH